MIKYRLGLLYNNHFNDKVKGNHWIKMSARDGNKKAKILVRKMKLDKYNNIKTIKEALNY